ncbi:MAG TPA: T9SS type A sorting domain-containing protein [Chitinophagales bacterium]|nr:T9SS type A sorting domain-containing protein [Chitinophagales bacterium]
MKKFSIAFILLLFFAFQNKAVAQSGSRDLTFGVDGRVMFHQKFNYEVATDIAITKDGKILLLMYSNDYSEPDYLVRFLADGTLDTTFGDQGKVSILEDWDAVSGKSLSVDDSDRILVLAEDNMYGEHGVKMFRFLPDGSSDASFNIMVNIGRDADNSFLIQSDGKIVTAATDGYYWGGTTRITRWNENGLPDSTFTTAELNSGFSFPLSITEQNDNKLLITGTSDSNLFVMRLLPDGLPDDSFGVNGTVLINDGGDEAGKDVTVAPNGKIYVTGYSETATESSFNCWRLCVNGNADITFGSNGLVTLHTGKQHNWGSFVFANTNSTAIVGGSVYNGATNDPVIYRLLDDGSVDMSYGSNGVAGKTFTCSKSIELNAVKIPDESILVCGTKVDNGNILPVISKFSSGGLNDTAFGMNGTSSVTLEDSEYVADDEHIDDFAFLPDGKILAGGVANDVTLFRLSQDGARDSSYGENGMLVPGAQAQYSRVISAYNDNSTYLIENFQHLIYGYQTFYIIDGLDGASDFVLHKFNADGTPDSSYGDFGVLHPLIAGYALSQCCTAIVQPDGKLLLSGFTAPNPWTDIFLLRLNSDGSADPTFGNQGIVILDFGTWEHPPFLALDDDGKIIFQNILHDQFTFLDSLLTLRLMPDGSSDASFGNNGTSKVLLGYLYFSNIGLALLPDHKILSLIWNSDNGHDKVLGLNSDGTIDTSFGVSGYRSLEYPHFSRSLMCTQPDGKILCLSNSYLTRMLSNGTFDTTFGTDGVALFDSTFSFGQCAIHLQSDGKIVVSGEANYGYYMARILNDVQTGIENLAVENNLNVFPNPCTSLLTLWLSAASENEMTIKVSDITGETIFTQKVSQPGDRFTVNVRKLPSGIYFLTLESIDQSTTVKFVKQ